MIKRMVIMLIVIGLILGGIFGFQAFKNRMIAAYLANLKAPPQTVSTITAAMSPWQTTLQSTGSFNAVQGASLSAQVQGIVQKIGFQDGQDVKNGDLIVQLLYERPYDERQTRAFVRYRFAPVGVAHVWSIVHIDAEATTHGFLSSKTERVTDDLSDITFPASVPDWYFEPEPGG